MVRAPAWAPQFWTTWRYSVRARPRLADRCRGHRASSASIVALPTVERAVLARRRDDGPPAARGARIADAHLGDRAVELAGLVLGTDDVEREVLEHPDPDAVPSGSRQFWQSPRS